MEDSSHTVFPDLAQLAEIPEDGILSRPILTNESVRMVLFAMSAGQELTEHTTSMEAILFFLKGDAEITLGQESHEVSAGALVHMPPRLLHSIRARTPLIMLLQLLKKP